MSFAFTNGSLTNGSSTNGSSTNGSPLSISSSVIKSYKDPYDAYKNKLNNQQQLFLIINGVIVEHLDTKLISVKWAIACAKRVLPIFEKWNLDDKRPRRAIEAAELLVLEPNAANYAAHATVNAAYAAAAAAIADNGAYYTAAAVYYAVSAANSAYYAASNNDTYAAYVANSVNSVNYANSANYAAAHAPITEIQWQRSQLRKIIKEHCKYYKKFNQLLCQRYPPELSSLIISNIF